jgi:F0F1-type ATP synthase assembly protein I
MSQKDPEEKKVMPVLLREGFGILAIGWDLAIPIFAGVLVGHALDVWLDTSYIFTLGLLTLGVMVSYYNLLRLIRRFRRQEHQREQNGEGFDKQ